MFVGLDLSLTASGVCVMTMPVSPAGWPFETFTIDGSKDRGPARLVKIRDRVMAAADGAQGAAIEGYAMGAKFGREALGELGGVIRAALWEAGIPYIIVAPNKLKLFATGHGGGDKGNVMVSVFKKYGLDGLDNNQADAVVLANMAQAYFGGIDAGELLAYEKKAMADVEHVPGRPRPIRVRTPIRAA